jgi:hypothetical protein
MVEKIGVLVLASAMLSVGAIEIATSRFSCDQAQEILAYPEQPFFRYRDKRRPLPVTGNGRRGFGMVGQPAVCKQDPRP